MIVRIWLVLGTLIVVAAWLLTVPYSPPPYQASPGSFAGGYRAKGLLPAIGEFKASEEIGHEVFEIPETDAAHMANAGAAGNQGATPGMAAGDHASMPGMSMPMPAASETPPAPPAKNLGRQEPAEQAPSAMPGMTAAEHAAMAGASVQMPAAPETPSAPPAMGMGQQAPAEQAPSAMPGMTAAEHAAMPGVSVPMPAAPETPLAPPAMGMGQQAPAEQAPSAMPGMTAAEHAAMAGMSMADQESEHGRMAQYGIEVASSTMRDVPVRNVEIEMSEWGFSPTSLEVKRGEVIRFTVRNSGRIPHEFMFMPATAMEALNYRTERADWSLTEHEAIFEREMILPGDSFQVTLRIAEPGSWMYMCMFPYHMQFGMMGMMFSEGAAMPGMTMGGMRM